MQYWCTYEVPRNPLSLPCRFVPANHSCALGDLGEVELKPDPTLAQVTIWFEFTISEDIPSNPLLWNPIVAKVTKGEDFCTLFGGRLFEPRSPEDLDRLKIFYQNHVIPGQIHSSI